MKLFLYSLKDRKKIMIVGTVLVLVTIVVIAATREVADIQEQNRTNELIVQEVERRTQFLITNNQDIDSAVIESESAAFITEKQDIESYAVENNIVVQDSDVQQLYDQRVTQEGSEEALLDKVDSLYGISKEEYLEVLRYDLLRNAVISQR